MKFRESVTLGDSADLRGRKQRKSSVYNGNRRQWAYLFAGSHEVLCEWGTH